MKRVKLTLLFLGPALSLLACNLGPLLLHTPTPFPTATYSPTIAPTSTETPTVSPAAIPTTTPLPTQTPAPTAVTCPKGTVLRPSTNRCFYATRTPKAEEQKCTLFSHKWACINNGCSWNSSTKTCS